MVKKKTTGLIVGLIILLFLTGISLFIIIFVPSNIEQYNENNTIEHQASVIEVINKEKRYEVRIKEYPAILAVAKNIPLNETYLLALQNGDQINFRVPDFYDDLLNNSEVSGVLIVSLNTNDVAIFTLEEYYNSEKEACRGAIITGAVFSGAFLCGAIVCLVFLIKLKKANINEVN